jgi:hypothetical protein
MKKSTLMLIVGAVIAFFGYRYFIKGKTASAATSSAGAPATDTKGTMIVPSTSVASSANDRKVLAVYTGGAPLVITGTGYTLGNGEKVEGILTNDGVLTVTRFAIPFAFEPGSIKLKAIDIMVMGNVA